MNLEKLFDMQKVLKDRIGYTGTDKFDKMSLALLVEVGECANEYRGFKYWSKNQQPRTKDFRGPFIDPEDSEEYNPLLEEYVDGLHFVLEHGLDDYYLEFSLVYIDRSKRLCKEQTVTEQFNRVFFCITKFTYDPSQEEYEDLLFSYLVLGEMLGFTPEQIEQAYMDKNKINHERQNNGY